MSEYWVKIDWDVYTTPGLNSTFPKPINFQGKSLFVNTNTQEYVLNIHNHLYDYDRNYLLGQPTIDPLGFFFFFDNSQDGTIIYDVKLSSAIEDFYEVGQRPDPDLLIGPTRHVEQVYSRSITSQGNVQYISEVASWNWTDWGWFKIGIAPVIATLDPLPVSEGDPVSFRVSLDRPVTYAVSLNYQSYANSADETDFLPAAGTITFNPGETLKEIVVETFKDDVTEGEEKFSLGLSGAIGGQPAPIIQNFLATAVIRDAIDITPLSLTLEAGGPFDISSDGTTANGNGTVLIGRTDGRNPLLKGVSATTSYTSETASISSGAFYSSIGGVTESLFGGKIAIDVDQLAGTITDDGSGAFKLGGYDIEFHRVTLSPTHAAYDATFTLPNGIGGIPIDLREGLIIDDAGPRMGVGGKYQLPDPVKLKVGEAQLEAEKLAIEYQPSTHSILGQGKFGITLAGQKISLDLSGPNHIRWDGSGAWDVVGKLTYAGYLGIGRWGLSGLEVELNTQTKIISGSASIVTPWGITIHPSAAQLLSTFSYDPFSLDSVKFSVTSLNKPIGQWAVWLQDVKGSIYNMAGLASGPTKLSLEIAATIGPSLQLGEGARLEAALTGTTTGSMLMGQAIVTFAPVSFEAFGKTHTMNAGRSTGSINWDVERGNLTLDGQQTFFGGLFSSNERLVANKNFDFTLFGNQNISVPDFSPILRGQTIVQCETLIQFTNDGVYANDFAQFSKVYQISTSGKTISFESGLKLAFDGTITPIGGRLQIGSSGSSYVSNSRTLSQQQTELPSDYIILQASWENANNDFMMTVTMPDGRFISEDQFATHEIMIVDELSNEFSRVAIVSEPTVGVWDVAVTSGGHLGSIETTILYSDERPNFEFWQIVWDKGMHELSIGYSAADQTAQPQ